jgi:uncharacterized RDD family membrane protein YckC
MIVRRLVNFYVDSMLSLFITLGLIVGLQSLNIDLSEYSFLQVVVQLIYYLLIEGLTGRTVGKLLTKTKVIHKEQGSRNKILSILFRTFCRVIPFEPLSVFFNDNRVMWHDKLSNTRVVKVEHTL